MSLLIYEYCSELDHMCVIFFFFQAEDGIRDLVRSRGLGDVYKRQEVLRVQLRELVVTHLHKT